MMDYRGRIKGNDHILFSFETGMELGKGDKTLLEQICLQYGFSSLSESLPLYFSGDDPEFSYFLPEWVYLRDTVFYFKVNLCFFLADLFINSIFQCVAHSRIISFGLC